jgi:hypothetical protein
MYETYSDLVTEPLIEDADTLSQGLRLPNSLHGDDWFHLFLDGQFCPRPL